MKKLIRLGKSNPLRRIHKSILKFVCKTKSKFNSSIKIDILIPVSVKDIELLKFTIACARENILNPISQIFIIGENGVIKDFCDQNNCVFIDEDSFLKIKKSSIKYNDIEWYRSGWIFQQLIKLNCDKLIGEENILVLDSDTFIFSKQSFVLDNGLSIINFSDEYHFPYSVFKKLINLKKRFYLSFVCHHMIINKEYLKEMKKCILHSTNKEWIDAIIDNIDLSEPSCFSEYELYGNYMYYFHRDKIHLEYCKNKNIKHSNLDLIVLKEKLKSRFKSISFHNFMNK